MEIISSPTIGEILREEFMKPLNLSVDRVANAVGTPASKIQGILNKNQKITVDTSIRLAKLFGVSDSYFLNLQNDIDTRNNKKFQQQNNPKYPYARYLGLLRVLNIIHFSNQEPLDHYPYLGSTSLVY